MHRSGTSLATRLLNLCGLQLGDPQRLLGARPDNPAGFWENLDFVALDDRILTRLDGAWDCPPTTAADPAELGDFDESARACVNCARGKDDGPWGWKDPRASLLLPFWTAQVSGLSVIVCLRHPNEVAASLTRRNGFSRRLGLHLWQLYNERLAADLDALQGVESVVTHYDALLARPEQELRRLTDWLGWPVERAVLGAACATVRPELRHHRGAGDTDALPAAIGDLYESLCRRAGPNFCATRFVDPREVAELNVRGEERFAAGDLTAATRIFSDVLILDAGYVRARNNLACALWRTGEYEEAITELSRALGTDPDHVDATWNLSQLLVELNHTTDAIELLTAYVNRHPESQEIVAELARLRRAVVVPAV